jgi:flagellar motor switch protein FliN/FliY
MLFAVSGALLALLAKPEPGLSEAPVEGTAASKTLDLLLEVELPVSVSFGRTEIPFKDVVKLSTGSILEIIVNNCVIARGEVVVIEGNYGVRVTQVISRQERLRTLY